MILKVKIHPLIEFTAPISKDQTEAPSLMLAWVFKEKLLNGKNVTNHFQQLVCGCSRMMRRNYKELKEVLGMKQRACVHFHLMRI